MGMIRTKNRVYDIIKAILVMVVMIWNVLANSQSTALEFNVLEFGAIQSTEVPSSKAIQSAIDSCYFSGGGIVYMPAGEYCSGTIVLKDNVTLWLAEGAVLNASRDINEYRMPLEDAIRPVLIYANGASNIGISGQGKIKGNAQHTYEDLRETDKFIEEWTENARKSGVEMKRYYIVKPDVGLVTLSKCKGINVRNVSIIESSHWSLHMIRCADITITGVTVKSNLDKGVNADGIDINSCQRVVIKDCVVSTGDDGIVLKSLYEEPCEEVLVSNCTVSSSSTALKLGTESVGDMRHIRFENCNIPTTNRGLSIVVRDGGKVEDVVFSNITMNCSRRHFNWWGDGDPIWIYLTKRLSKTKVGSIDNVVFENITALGMGTSRIESTEEEQIHNIKLINVKFMMDVENEPDKRADHALYAKNVEGLSLQNLEIHWNENDLEEKWRSALVVEDCRKVDVTNFYGRQGIKQSIFPVIEFKHVSESKIDNIRFMEGTNLGVKIGGERSRNIDIFNIDRVGVSTTPVFFDEDVNHESNMEIRLD